MYDLFASQLIESLPSLPGLDHNACRRALSAAYFYIVRSRFGISNDDSTTDFRETQSLLRRMGDALESIAVFDPLNGQDWNNDVREASAFVAGEALAILADLTPRTNVGEQSKDVLFNFRNYIAIESALLYMIGGYDINAISVVREISVSTVNAEELPAIVGARLTNATYVLSRILSFCRGEVRSPRQNIPLVQVARTPKPPEIYDLILEEIRAHLYNQIGRALDSYLDWLGAYNNNGLETAVNSLQSARDTARSTEHPSYATFGDIYHLSSLLLATIDRTSHRSLTHLVPEPPDGDETILKDFSRYLQHRARGDTEHLGRPFVWPSVREYIQDCLPGPSKDAVVAMPTGSGKSFLAELAIANALSSGWVLYLTPTNALAYQVRRDLTYALAPFSQVQIRSYVGSEEYTTLSEEQINFPETHFVAVMTPEKCALALRLRPDRFTNCSLCVFDECHLLNDRERGVTADILLAQLMFAAPKVRLTLMSAMVSNAEELAEWLGSARNSPAIAKIVKWRPSRTMRGLLVLDKDSFNANSEEAKRRLEQKPKRKTERFNAPLALIAGLSGPWSMTGPADYRITRLPLSYETRITQDSRNSPAPQFAGWKNMAASLLSEQFARSRMPAICFLLSSKHHAFSNADRIIGEMPGSIGAVSPFPRIIEAYLAIAEAELGMGTVLRDLLRRGIAVHTAAMLPTEQSASEWMFSHEKAVLMFATGTLAQGLNLPATAVVVAGTSLADPRDTVVGFSRVNGLILNGFGRAGRPGFSNQGIAVLVSDRPFAAPITHELDPTNVLNQYAVLAESDAAIDVHSPVESFLDHLISGVPITEGATRTELELTSLLAEYDKEDLNAGKILKRTLAAYHKRNEFNSQIAEQARIRIAELKADFLLQPNVPAWMNAAAMKAGVEFFHAQRMWIAYQKHGFVSIEEGLKYGVDEWLEIFFQVMSLLPPRRVLPYLEKESIKRRTVLTKLRDMVGNRKDLDKIPWDYPKEWSITWQELKNIISKFMNGYSYSEIAQQYLGITANQITDKRTKGDNPIPATLAFMRNTTESLSIDAGCFLALHELATAEKHGTTESIPESLQALPLCIRNGCNSLGTLSWFRFGYRERVCAHSFESVFPVPITETNDTERARWVDATRRDWLAGKLEAANQPILEFAMTVIKESS